MSRTALQRGGGAPDGVVSVAVGICPLAAINLPMAATTQGGSERRSRSAASVTDPAFPDRALALADLDYWDSV
jgi:hypothetical protein